MTLLLTMWFALANGIYRLNMNNGLKWACVVELVPLHFYNDHEKNMLQLTHPSQKKDERNIELSSPDQPTHLQPEAGLPQLTSNA